MFSFFLASAAALCPLASSVDDHLDCFPEWFPYDYYDCCRNLQGSTGLPFLANQCFDMHRYTFWACCNFKFGPTIRGLGHQCTAQPGGVAYLAVGSAGLLGMACQQSVPGAPPGSEPRPALEVWIHSYLAARLLVDFRSVLAAEGRGAGAGPAWPEGAKVLARLLDLGRPLRVLDVGCGVGLLSIAAARAGHNVTALDNNPYAIALVRRNARKNRVRVHARVWDMVTEPDPSLLARGPFDVVYSEPGSLLMGDYRADPNSQDMGRTNSIMAAVLNQLMPFRGRVYLSVAAYGKKHATSGDIEFADVATMYAFTHYGYLPQFRHSCKEGHGTCETEARVPTMSPRQWISSRGLGPPTQHAYILW